MKVQLPWERMGLAKGGAKVGDLWLRQDIGSQSGVSVMLPAHGSALYQLTIN